MDKKFAIFDMDGTLIDSMPYWRGLALEYLKERGIEHVPPAIFAKIVPLTMKESTALFIREFGIPGTPETVAAEMNAVMEGHYRGDIPLKPQAAEYLRRLQRNGVRMCVASATAEPLVRICLGRLGVLDCFDFILSCETVGAGKNRPDVYLQSAQRLGAAPDETAVYEDAIYAARTAKEAGFYVVGIYDESSRENWEQMTEIADETMREFIGF